MSLSSRGINGQRCLNCCERQRLSTEISIRGLLKELIQAVLQAGDSGREDMVLALVPLPGTPQVIPPPVAPKIVTAPRGTPFGIGAIVFFAVRALSSAAAQLAVLEVLLDLLDILEVFLPDDCQDCIRKNLWGQDNRQERLTSTIRKRIRDI